MTIQFLTATGSKEQQGISVVCETCKPKSPLELHVIYDSPINSWLTNFTAGQAAENHDNWFMGEHTVSVIKFEWPL